MARTDEEIYTAWRRYHDQATDLAVKVGDDPLRALEYGLSVSPQSDARNPESPRAAVLRAAADHLIPQAFEWEVLSAVGGACFLAFKAYRPEHE